MRNSTHFLMAGLLTLGLLTSCSRQAALVQRSPREHFATTTPAKAATNSNATILPMAITETAIAEITPVAAVPETAEASVKAISNLSADKKVQKRLERVRTILATASTKASPAVSANAAPKKPNLMERTMLKKINKKISKQLAPQNPEKAMLNAGTLATGAVFVLLGLLLLLLTTGTAATIGLIALVVGAVLLLVGLL